MNLLTRSVETMLLKFINVDRYLPLQIDITNSCNLRCVHCYHPHHNNAGAIGFAEWKLILTEYKKLIRKMSYRPWVMLCGGEPMVNPHFFEILDFISSELPSSKISILTNGTLLTDVSCKKFLKYKNIQFQVSLDGPDATRHNQIRGQNNFKKSIDGIQKLKALGLEVHVLSVLSQKTKPWMEDFFKLAKKEKFDSMNFVRFVPEGYGRRLMDAKEDKPVLGLELKSALQNVLHFMMKYQVKSKTQGPLFDLIMPGLGRSGRFWEAIVVDYQGYVVASSRSKMRLGHSLNDGLEKIFLDHEIYRSLRSGQVKICGTCPQFNVCGGDRNAAYAATGDYLGFDPGCWKFENQNNNISEGVI